MTHNNPDVIYWLRNSQDEFVFRISGQRLFRDQKMSWVVYHLPYKLGSRVDVGRPDSAPLMPQIERLAGIQIDEGVQKISVSLADAEAREHFGLAEEAKILRVNTVYFDKKSLPIEYVKSVSREIALSN
jgi:DNA-binding GntR family transcriptional regulator